MTEQVSTQAAASPAAATPPVEAAPVTSPVEAASTTPSPVTTAATTEAAPVAPVEAAKQETTLLGADPAPVEVKKDASVEANKAPDTKKEEGGQSAEAAQLPTYEDFKLPEGFTHDKEKLSAFVKDLSELQTSTKADQKTMQAFGQKLMDKYVAEVQNVIKQVQEQNEAANKSKISGWKAEFEKAPDKDTVLKSAGTAISLLPKDGLGKEFRQFLNETGVGNNQTLARVLAHYEKVISGYKAKYESEAGVKPLAAQVSPEKPKGIAQKMYGTMK